MWRGNLTKTDTWNVTANCYETFYLSDKTPFLTAYPLKFQTVMWSKSAIFIALNCALDDLKSISIFYFTLIHLQNSDSTRRPKSQYIIRVKHTMSRLQNFSWLSNRIVGRNDPIIIRKMTELVSSLMFWEAYVQTIWKLFRDSNSLST